MKRETEIRDKYSVLKWLIDHAHEPPPAGTRILFATLEYLVTPTFKTAREIREKQALLLENSGAPPSGSDLMAAEILAWALDDEAWPNYELATNLIDRTYEIGKMILALRN